MVNSSLPLYNSGERKDMTEQMLYEQMLNRVE